LTSESLGIDVGIKELAVCSDGKFKPNINKTKRVRRLEKKLKREQRKVSHDLKLKDRVFVCSCGFEMDRDLNAAINLANYQIQGA
jgi:transposase